MSKTQRSPEEQDEEEERKDRSLNYGADWAENTRLFVKEDGGVFAYAICRLHTQSSVHRDPVALQVCCWVLRLAHASACAKRLVCAERHSWLGSGWQLPRARCPVQAHLRS